mmetsp:Transcript_31090/g.66608  ORF Transcript_31090/g.66608 Transcript_31090/m.66608 type:complete len:319 (+) Transcript_31090:58-1014(+)|eukprot:CAMPEP_0171426186 /NCGR_PEP_ID=MMETSP0881-20121228/3805_1 /TAXON_ID=67004 /ORGANISM="Thalassiosira weissflogii, Strain CCMP1336" /LENGTH=318 /DNA_ID=CAMNT_0011945637 /DNA_START=21 /DNA_END=977 /DNA_ORIENTATION=+
MTNFRGRQANQVHRKWSLLRLAALAAGANAFSTPFIQRSGRPSSPLGPPSKRTSLSMIEDDGVIANNVVDQVPKQASAILSSIAALAILAAPLNVAVPGAAWADEWGKETEAPTLFTGETIMICKKRGPLGACLETTVRTSQNDNDKANKYFLDPSEDVKRKREQMLSSLNEESEGNALIQKLRMQSEENREKNEMTVRQKTLLNDQSASFGPFDRQVVILNTDGKTFTLLQNPQAMRLKKAGYIEDRKFVIQPSQEVIDEALEGKNDLGEAIKGFFGGGGGAEAAATKENAIESSSDSVSDAASTGDVAESAETKTE